jgi:hypothetical protein
MTVFINDIIFDNTDPVALEGEWQPSLGAFPPATVEGRMRVATDSGSVGGMDFTTGETIIYDDGSWRKISPPDVNDLIFKGQIDASTTSTYPSSPNIGDVYEISVAGTIQGTPFYVGDMIYYNGSGFQYLRKNQLPFSDITDDGSPTGTTLQSAIDSANTAAQRANETIVFKPGSTNSPTYPFRFSDWTDAFNAVNALSDGIEATLIIDTTDSTTTTTVPGQNASYYTAVVPDGTWDFGERTVTIKGVVAPKDMNVTFTNQFSSVLHFPNTGNAVEIRNVTKVENLIVKNDLVGGRVCFNNGEQFPGGVRTTGSNNYSPFTKDVTFENVIFSGGFGAVDSSIISVADAAIRRILFKGSVEFIGVAYSVIRQVGTVSGTFLDVEFACSDIINTSTLRLVDADSALANGSNFRLTMKNPCDEGQSFSNFFIRHNNGATTDPSENYLNRAYEGSITKVVPVRSQIVYRPGGNVNDSVTGVFTTWPNVIADATTLKEFHDEITIYVDSLTDIGSVLPTVTNPRTGGSMKYAALDGNALPSGADYIIEGLHGTNGDSTAIRFSGTNTISPFINFFSGRVVFKNIEFIARENAQYRFFGSKMIFEDVILTMPLFNPVPTFYSTIFDVINVSSVEFRGTFEYYNGNSHTGDATSVAMSPFNVFFNSSGDPFPFDFNTTSINVNGTDARLARIEFTTDCELNFNTLLSTDATAARNVNVAVETGTLIKQAPKIVGRHMDVNALPGATTAYTLTSLDAGSVILFDTTSACTITLPQQSTEAVVGTPTFNFRNKQSGQITLVTQGSDTIAGAGTVTVDATKLNSVYLEEAGTPNSWVSVGALI